MNMACFLRNTIRRFREDRSGNVLMMFGLMLVPLIGVTGVALDYSRASNTRQALAAAIDSAALMAARDAQKLTSDADLTARINAWLKDSLPADVKEQFTTATVSIDRTARTVKITANADVPTTIARVLGSEKIAVASNTEATWGTNTIELALVLDNTGSMAATYDKKGAVTSDKLGELKKASKALIEIMRKASNEPGQIKISIVPFNTQVRIARSFAGEPWIRYGLIREVNCRREWIQVLSDWRNVCDKEIMNKDFWSKDSQGCITDRNQGYDAKDGGYSSQDEQYPGYWCAESSLAEIRGLSEDWTALSAHVDTMKAAGNTNITIGAAWGWATLSSDAPFTEAKPLTEPRLKKYMILLTDGDNTENRFGKKRSDIDGRTESVCKNAKAYGITIYTIRVIDGNEDLLKECATDAGKYHNVSDAAQLEPIFRQIAGEISQVRLTQ